MSINSFCCFILFVLPLTSVCFTIQQDIMLIILTVSGNQQTLCINAMKSLLVWEQILKTTELQREEIQQRSNVHIFK